MQTGTPPGATGSGDQKNTIQPIDKAKATWAGILEPTLLSSSKHYVNSLFGVMPLTIAKERTSDWLREAEAALANELRELEQVSMALTPRDRIIRSLGVIAEVLQVELPSAEALKIYAQLLEEIPVCCWNETCQAVLKEHKYNTLPKPADFLRSAEPVRRQAQSVVALIRQTNRKISEALQIQGEINVNP